MSESASSHELTPAERQRLRQVLESALMTPTGPSVPDALDRSILSKLARVAGCPPELSEADVIAHSPYADSAEWDKASAEEKAHWQKMAVAGCPDEEAK